MTTIEQLQQDKQSLENSISGLINTFIYQHEGISLNIGIRTLAEGNRQGKIFIPCFTA